MVSCRLLLSDELVSNSHTERKEKKRSTLNFLGFTFSNFFLSSSRDQSTFSSRGRCSSRVGTITNSRSFGGCSVGSFLSSVLSTRTLTSSSSRPTHLTFFSTVDSLSLRTSDSGSISSSIVSNCSFPLLTLVLTWLFSWPGFGTFFFTFQISSITSWISEGWSCHRDYSLTSLVIGTGFRVVDSESTITDTKRFVSQKVVFLGYPRCIGSTVCDPTDQDGEDE